MIEVYKDSVVNVREIKSNRKKIKKLLNLSIKNKLNSNLDLLTKIYAVIYSSFAEICFLKMIHTPYGFSENTISQINTQRNLEEKWRKCMELAFIQINNLNNVGEIQNKKLILNRLIDKYIIEPSQLRNKIAHGQWKVALNNNNTARNNQTTLRINNLDFVQIDILFEIYEKIGQVVEDLIESPHKTHFRDFYNHLVELEELVEKTEQWTLETKISLLTKKYMYQKNGITNTNMI
jgi:hypothetical protein